MANDTFEPDMTYAGDDAVVPFQVEGLDIRGRAIQMGGALDQILSRHDYPEVVARLLAETVILTVLLGTTLKFQGKFILQTQSDGPVDMLVVDFQTPDAVRAYARFDEERLNASIEAGKTQPEDLLGRGTLGLTIDQGAHMQRYQGLVALDGSTLEEIARNYFLQSEQIPTDIRISVAQLMERDSDGTLRQGWRAGGLMIQFLPQSGIAPRQRDLPGGDAPVDAAAVQVDAEDEWQEARALVGTIESSELTDPQVAVERLLYRLFHERGVRVYEPARVVAKCSCSREKIEGVLSGFSAEEIQESTEDGQITVNCEFCSTNYVFDPAEFAK
ncbi:Hsp33 family molecular chaperone [Paenochrobactrum sp. BZR 588]|uniref:Hsp33 family molecular chaperone n=1 Tax=Paenochrobactrum TaxID=999488 RepID=UPI0035BC2481